LLDKPASAWQDGTIVEFGPGPAGYVEYLPARRRIAIEPLIDRYRPLFPHLRTSSVEYLSCPAEAADAVPSRCADLVISFNMLDHTRDPDRVVAQMARVAKPGADLLFQVNTYLTEAELAEKTGPHADLHPHSFFPQTAKALLERHGFAVRKEFCAAERTADGEHNFVCAATRV
jgi:SAM-dependent methyltransferase